MLDIAVWLYTPGHIIEPPRIFVLIKFYIKYSFSIEEKLFRYLKLKFSIRV